MEFAAPSGVLSGYHRRVMPSGDWLSVHGGPPQAATQSKITIPAAWSPVSNIGPITPYAPGCARSEQLQSAFASRSRCPASVACRLRAFEPARAIEQNDALVSANPAIGQRLFVGGIGRGPFGAQQQSLFTRNLLPCVGDCVVA